MYLRVAVIDNGVRLVSRNPRYAVSPGLCKGNWVTVDLLEDSIDMV